MNTNNSFEDRFEQIAFQLELTYGPRPFQPSGDLELEVVATVLSQSTSDRNSARAMRALRSRFQTWDEVIDAPTDELTRTIAIGGLARTKAPKIQHLLRTLRQHHITMESLAEMQPDAALRFLESMNGLGPKSAACILLFGAGVPVFPVDTHIARVATRLGLVPPRTSTSTKQRQLLGLTGAKAADVYAMHVEMIEHGRQVCHSTKPDCPSCALLQWCDYGRTVVDYPNS